MPTTLLILTDEESRLVRTVLNDPFPDEHQRILAVGAYNNGVARGTAKLKEQAAEEFKRNRGKG